MEWWFRDELRWGREVEEMSSWYPNSQWAERKTNGINVRYWEILIESTPPPDELPLVISDLERDGIVDVEKNGKLRHSQQCHSDHKIHNETLNLKLIDDVFLIELTYREPPGYPMAKCIIPNWSKVTLPDHPHFYNEGFVCPIFPPDGTWQWRKNTAADYLHHVSTWILKTAIWKETKDKTGKGIWIGRDAGHTLDYLLRVNPNEDCPCGSGHRFHKCCQRRLIIMSNNIQRRKTNEIISRSGFGCGVRPDSLMGI
jgi:hypothetical protein